ncbi:DUF6882 domain-containing protein [Corynebacterium sp. HS2168-gen11]|uniref:DUF6882 domain-containing protein n=1 Tax=Corynebacterium sp. HS2168-gen11 TaxID=2974027 RepID=UPI00216AF44A|nr:DUF6882 domain-containing protein [Corynebacterium sp. HS2168-gen11]MCS4536360.1 hypothetical protein [Corynebacterium sp. HS2168-gen11]
MPISFPAPQHVQELLTDGFFAALRRDVAVALLVGNQPTVRYSTSKHGYMVELQGNGNQIQLPAVVVGQLGADHVTVTWEPILDQYPFLGTVLTDEILQAVRTCYRGALPFLLPDNIGGATILMATPDQDATALPSLAETLLRGLSRIPDHYNLHRALVAFAGIEAHPIQLTDSAVVFADSCQVDLARRQLVSDMSLAEIAADAFYLGLEHQLFFQQQFRQPRIELSQDHQQAKIHVGEQSFVARACVVGIIADGTFTFAYHLSPHLSLLREFAVTHGIPELFSSLSIQRAQQLGVEHCAKRILKMWTHAFVPLTENTSALVLIDANPLHLPSVTPEIRQYVLHQPVPPLLDQARAAAAYTQLRPVASE